MQPRERFMCAMAGGTPDRVPVVPKIWVDLACRIMDVPFLDALNDPELGMKTVARANLKLGMDAARLFTFAKRRVRKSGDLHLHVDSRGRRLGTVDMSGGWATHFDDPRRIDLGDPEIMVSYGHFASSEPALKGPEDVKRIAVPSAQFYEEAGYGRMVDETAAEMGDRLGLIGDCSSGTLAFYVALRGMTPALLDFFDNPGLVRAAMEKGIEYCLERARFFLAHGVTVLRYNDSAANMTVISPSQWREFIFPHIQTFCAEVHRMNPAAKVYCHICGNTLPIIPALAETGLDCIAPLDPMGGMTVADARRAAGPEIVLMGGVNTMSFVQSTPEALRDEARRCIAEGGPRYILGSGCALPRGTKIENLVALREAAAG